MSDTEIMHTSHFNCGSGKKNRQDGFFLSHGKAKTVDVICKVLLRLWCVSYARAALGDMVTIVLIYGNRVTEVYLFMVFAIAALQCLLAWRR